MSEPVQWGVYWAPVAMRARGGRKGDHPVVVVQSPGVTAVVSTVLVIPITSDFGGPKTYVRRLTVERNPFLDHDSWALVPNVGPMERKSLARLERAGDVHELDVAQLKAALRFVLGLM